MWRYIKSAFLVGVDIPGLGRVPVNVLAACGFGVLQALPEHEGEEANEDVGLDAILTLVPDRPNVQLVFVDAESGLGLGELDIGFPQLPIASIGDVRAQQMSAAQSSKAAL